MSMLTQELRYEMVGLTCAGGWRREEKLTWIQEAQNCMKSMGIWNLDPRPPHFTALSYLYVLLWTSYLSEPQSLPL